MISSDSYHLHVKIHPKYQTIAKQLALKYGSIQKVIEEGLQLIAMKEYLSDRSPLGDLRIKGSLLSFQKSEIDTYKLTELMAHDYKMVLVGRRTFLSYIDNFPTTPIEENNCIELVEWFYDNKIPLSTLNLSQILHAIVKMWEAANYFTNADLIPLDISPQTSGTASIERFKVVIYHDFTDKRFGQYWSRYFEYVLSHPPINAHVSNLELRNQTFFFTVER